MNSSESANNITDEEKINRRSFLTKSVGYTTAGLSLLAFPGIITETLAAKGDKSKEEIFKILGEKVSELYPVYHTCSQPTLAALNEQFGLNAAQTVSAINLFAGGIAGKGETCGAVTGALLAIGFYFELKKQTARPGSSMIHGGAFFDRFAKEFGSTRCSEVINHQYSRYYDFSNMEDMKLFTKEKENGKCVEVMTKAVHIAADIILENS